MRTNNFTINAAAAAFLFCAVCTNARSRSYDIPGAVSVREADTTAGVCLTMEQTILSRELLPRSIYFEWSESGHTLTYFKDSQERRIVPEKKGETLLSRSPLKETIPQFAQEASSYVESPAGQIYACTLGNSLYLCDDIGVTPVAESQDDGIVYGQSVSRNEFGINGGIFWSKDGSKLAFYRKDESDVTQFPLLDITTRTGSLKQIRYPMAGMQSERLRVVVYDLHTRDTLHLQTEDFGADRYLTGVTWSPDGKRIFIQVLDRSQKHMRLNMYDSANGEFIKTVLTEDNEKYVEPSDPLYFIKCSRTTIGEKCRKDGGIDADNGRFIYRTANRHGYKNLYLCDTLGNVTRISDIDADVEYVANDGRYVYYTTAEFSPVENHLMRVNIETGDKLRLTSESGWHSISMSPDCKWFVDSYSSMNIPNVVNLRSTDGKKCRNLFTSEDPVRGHCYTEMILGTVKSADGLYDNWYRLILPKDFDASKKYPVIVYVYGGPHSQMVRNTYLAELRRWEMYMAQRGYVVYVQDNRGTQNRGLAFEQAIHGQCGVAETEDQMKGVEMLMSLPFVDSSRIGVHGWSYGGFMTITLMTSYPDIFKVGVAGGPVIDWKWYEVMYGERYMGTPQDNPQGYEATSLILKADRLKGKLLICQGAVDNTVVWQHSLNFLKACIEKQVQVDYFPYPCAEHNVFSKDRVHLMNKVTMYFDDYL